MCAINLIKNSVKYIYGTFRESLKKVIADTGLAFYTTIFANYMFLTLEKAPMISSCHDQANC